MTIRVSSPWWVREMLVLWRKERVATRRCVECHGQPLCEAGNSILLETHIVSLASRYISTSRGLSEVNAFQRRHDGLTFPSQEMLVFLGLKFRSNCTKCSFWILEMLGFFDVFWLWFQTSLCRVLPKPYHRGHWSSLLKSSACRTWTHCIVDAMAPINTESFCIHRKRSVLRRRRMSGNVQHCRGNS